MRTATGQLAVVRAQGAAAGAAGLAGAVQAGGSPPPGTSPSAGSGVESTVVQQSKLFT